MGLTSWRKMWGMFGHVWYQPSILQCETVTHPGICVRSWKFFRIYLPFLIPVSNCFRIIESGGFEYLPIFPMNFINRSPMIPYDPLWIPMNPLWISYESLCLSGYHQALCCLKLGDSVDPKEGLDPIRWGGIPLNLVRYPAWLCNGYIMITISP